MALGIADGRPERTVLAVIGDGDLIMGASSLFSLSGLQLPNLLVVVLDDGRYTITGGQSVVAPEALAAVAKALPGVDVAVAIAPAEVTAALARPAARAWCSPKSTTPRGRARARS